MIGAFKMDYTRFTSTILQKVFKAMALINNPEVDPEVRQRNHEILFRELGASVYGKIYDMNAFDFQIEHTRGAGIDDRYYGLAKISSATISAGGVAALEQQVENYINQTIAYAQRDATTNAIENGKHPTVTRSMVSETCDWCQSLVGTYTNPGPDVFRRHRKCDCRITTAGYRSRNGELKNYVKPKDR